MKDEEEISRILASLKTVDAPEDFEGGVRSRIAERRDSPALWRPSIMLVAKFAFPMLLLIAVGGYLVVFDDRPLNGEMVPPVVNPSRDVAIVGESRSEPAGVLNARNVNASSAQNPVNRKGGNSRPVPQSGSEDVALTSDNTMVFPDGLDPRKAKATNTTKPPTSRGISPIQLLSMMGILGACTPQSCQVREVQNGSLAQKAGIHVGDLVKKIGKRPIDSFHSTSFEVNTLEIVRDGKLITISLGRL